MTGTPSYGRVNSRNQNPRHSRGSLAAKAMFMKKKMMRSDETAGCGKPKRIKHIQFSMMSGLEMERASELQVSNKQLYDISTRSPVPYGCLDPRLGVSDKTSECVTCGKKLEHCSGHFGHIMLELPVFHIGYYKAIQAVLNTICKVSFFLLFQIHHPKYKLTNS